MTNILFNLISKNTPREQEARFRARVGAMSGAVGIGCNLLLFGFKLAVALLSGSVAIMADAWNNLSDASGAIVTLVGCDILCPHVFLH